MFVGQIQAAHYMGSRGISAVRAHSPFRSTQTTPTRYDRVEIGTRSQGAAYSGTYKPNSDQMRALGNTSYTWAAPDSRLQAELLPPSEQASYTEEDACSDGGRSSACKRLSGATLVQAGASSTRI